MAFTSYTVLLFLLSVYLCVGLGSALPKGLKDHAGLMRQTHPDSSFLVEGNPDNGPMCSLQFKDCGSPQGKLLAVTYNGTCKAGLALLKKGTYALIKFQFQANEEETKLTSVVHGQVGPASVPFPLKNADACKDSGLKCPVKAKTPVSFSAVLYIEPIYPSLNVLVKWELQDKSAKDVFCAVIPVTIVS